MDIRDGPHCAEDEQDPQRESGRCAGDIHLRFQEEGEGAGRPFGGERRGTLLFGKACGPRRVSSEFTVALCRVLFRCTPPVWRGFPGHGASVIAVA